MLLGMRNKKILKEFEKNINKFAQEPCSIAIKNCGEKGTSLELSGNQMAIFVTMAGAVHKILEETGLPEDLFFLLVANSSVETRGE